MISHAEKGGQWNLAWLERGPNRMKRGQQVWKCIPPPPEQAKQQGCPRQEGYVPNTYIEENWHVWSFQAC